MTTSGRSPFSGFRPGRRSLLGGLLGGASTAALATLGHGGTAAASQSAGSAAQPPQIDFDLDTGNFIRDLVSSQDREEFEEFVAPMDVTIVERVTHLTTTAWFDAVAPYHPTAVGVHSRLGRRPSSESNTNRNLNTAALHATYQVIKGLMPEREPVIGGLLMAIGLDPTDESEDRTTAVGLGNLAGKGVLADTVHDGMNQLGDEGRTYNGRPYEDYTGYEPVNTAFKLRNPSRWQPQLGPHNRRQGVGKGDKGVFVVQQFATPQLRLTKAHTFSDPGEFRLAPPRHIDHHRPRDYKRSVDEILEASANLTDKQKIEAEFFDNKLLGIGMSGLAAAHAHDEMDLAGWIHLFFTLSTSVYDALIAAWHQKLTYDAVRPWSAIRHVYGSRKVTAWGGPGMGTVNDMPADQWASYLKVGDHADYPSGSTTLCGAEAQAARRFFGDDRLDWREVAPAGSALQEPGITPANDVEMYWATWTEFVETCAISRVWGGVHFKTTVEKSAEFGEQFGDMAYEFAQRHINGDVED
ncbi:vanadium-dependent haloperoxidase [Streptomyces sp. SBT349]|uniref:vanadium-dependent haloperoxidase n=1 Tax=Streptomyces sp. SBT349 TaxID=1580539 RepID=UPI00066B1385|nr:vanadium-dependent haloperoxidase [Streptomyces sp. SBT349]